MKPSLLRKEKDIILYHDTQPQAKLMTLVDYYYYYYYYYYYSTLCSYSWLATTTVLDCSE